MPMIHDDQAALAFVRSQTAHIEAQVYREPLPDITYPQLIPVDTSAHPFADTVIYTSDSQYGRAEWINGNADDVPMAGTARNENKTPVYTAAIGYGYGFEEIERAKMMNVSLTSDRAMAARRGYEEFIETTALLGSTEKGMQGLLNSTAVTATAAGAAWGADSMAVLASINNLLLSVQTATNFARAANVLMLPFTKMAAMAAQVLPNTAMTLRSFIASENIFSQTTGQPLTIIGSRYLDTAGVGNTTRAVAYLRDPEVLKLHIPMPLRFLPVHRPGPLRYEVPGVFRLGGLDIRQPKAVRYLDGI